MPQRKASLRGCLVVAHRLAGLTLAAFLVVAGLTGSLLVWNAELDAALNPHWFRTTASNTNDQPMDALELRDVVQARHPHALAARVPLAQEPGHALVFLLRPLPGKAPLENDQVFVDPNNGQFLGERRWGDITQTWRNLMPFVYRLHYSLALGAVGTWLLGLVSLLWMLAVDARQHRGFCPDATGKREEHPAPMAGAMGTCLEAGDAQPLARHLRPAPCRRSMAVAHPFRSGMEQFCPQPSAVARPHGANFQHAAAWHR